MGRPSRVGDCDRNQGPSAGTRPAGVGAGAGSVEGWAPGRLGRTDRVLCLESSEGLMRYESELVAELMEHHGWSGWQPEVPLSLTRSPLILVLYDNSRWRVFQRVAFTAEFRCPSWKHTIPIAIMQTLHSSNDMYVYPYTTIQ